MKQAIVVRIDLKMDRGKIAAQCAHASVAAFLRANENDKNIWMEKGMKKVVLKVKTETDLKRLYAAAKKAKLPCELIVDRGLTQVKPGTITAVGIGPAEDKAVDKITGKLKLL